MNARPWCLSITPPILCYFRPMSQSHATPDQLLALYQHMLANPITASGGVNEITGKPIVLVVKSMAGYFRAVLPGHDVRAVESLPEA